MVTIFVQNFFNFLFHNFCRRQRGRLLLDNLMYTRLKTFNWIETYITSFKNLLKLMALPSATLLPKKKFSSVKTKVSKVVSVSLSTKLV